MKNLAAALLVSLAAISAHADDVKSCEAYIEPLLAKVKPGEALVFDLKAGPRLVDEQLKSQEKALLKLQDQAIAGIKNPDQDLDKDAKKEILDTIISQFAIQCPSDGAHSLIYNALVERHDFKYATRFISERCKNAKAAKELNGLVSKLQVAEEGRLFREEASSLLDEKFSTNMSREKIIKASNNGFKAVHIKGIGDSVKDICKKVLVDYEIQSVSRIVTKNMGKVAIDCQILPDFPTGRCRTHLEEASEVIVSKDNAKPYQKMQVDYQDDSTGAYSEALN